MIVHKVDQGVIGTQRPEVNILRCAACGTQWLDKRDLWQDCVTVPEMAEIGQVTHASKALIDALPVKRDPKEARYDTVVVGIIVVDDRLIDP